jgi:TPR repeat protein
MLDMFKKKAVPNKEVQDLIDRSNAGDAEAQCLLAVRHYQGDGVSKDLEKAIELYRLSAEQGYARAQRNLAVRYHEGEGVTKNLDEAVKWFKLSAIQNDSRSIMYLSELFTYKDLHYKIDNNEALIWIRQGVKQNLHHSMLFLADYYYEGRVVSQSIMKSVYWAIRGLIRWKESEYNYLTNEISEVKQSMKSRLDELSSDEIELILLKLEPYITAEFRELLHKSKQDTKSLINDLISKANSGDVEAQYLLAKRYNAGKKIGKNPAEAFRLFKQAADQGFAGAQRELGKLYLNGAGVKQDYQEAMKWLKFSIDQSDPDAMLEMSSLYRLGKGMMIDKKEACYWEARAFIQKSYSLFVDAIKNSNNEQRLDDLNSEKINLAMSLSFNLSQLQPEEQEELKSRLGIYDENIIKNLFKGI